MGLANLCYFGVVIIGAFMDNSQVRGIGLIALYGNALIAMLSQVQLNGGFQWSVGAYVVTFFGMLEINAWNRPYRLRGHRERQALKTLFGEETFMGLLLNDPRLKNWRNKT
jgi:hypothetical protein